MISDSLQQIFGVTGDSTELRELLEAARKNIARHAVSLEDYAMLCDMILSDPGAAQNYLRDRKTG